jgi:transcriptional regulator with XRE-family HTH domain
MARGENDPPNFGQVIRNRRRELNLTLKQVAERVGTSKPYIAHLESGARHPSDRVVARLARALGLEGRRLFLLANPQAQALISQEGGAATSTWEKFLNDKQLQRLHDITEDEMEVLSRVALLGEVYSPADLIYVLNAIRHAIGR